VSTDQKKKSAIGTIIILQGAMLLGKAIVPTILQFLKNNFYVTGNVSTNILYISNKRRLFMCSPFVRKEANRFYWLVKGMLIPESWPDKDVERIYDSYMVRLWGIHERIAYGSTGFEAAYKAREAKIINDSLEKVAVLGYN